MAGKVNTRFVVLLSIGLVAVFGLLAWAFASLAFKSGGDYERLGDKAMAEGDHYVATRMYGRAVGHDTTNRVWLDKWLTAMESWTPETETAYFNAFSSNYLGAISQLAASLRTDVAAHERLLDVMYGRLQWQYSRGAADQVAETATDAAAYFDRATGVDESWRRLLRYRGLAREAVYRNNGVLTEDEIALIGEDLRAAVAADPADGESWAALMRYTLTTETRGEKLDAAAASARGLEKAMVIGREALASDPDNPYVRLAMVQYKLQMAFESHAGAPAAERQDRVMADFAALMPELTDLETLMRRLDPATVNPALIDQFAGAEQRIDPSARLARTRELVDFYLDSRPDSAPLLSVAAGVARTMGDLETASSRLAEVTNLPTLPISLRGLLRYEYQRSALLTRADVTLDRYEQTPAGETDQRAALLDTARQLRQQFATQVSEDNPRLMLLDGRIALVRGETGEALRLFSKFNEQTQNRSSDGLFFEARAAMELGRTGTSETALRRLLEIDPSNYRALLALAQIRMQLQNYRGASELFNTILRIAPTNEAAQEGLRAIARIENPGSIEDPVVSLMGRARLLRVGSGTTQADPAAAARLLQDNIADLGYAEPLVADLVSLLLDMNDLRGARAVVAEAVAVNPDSAVLGTFADALAGENLLEVRYRVIEHSSANEEAKLSQIAGLALRYQDNARLDEALARLGEIAPDSSSYIDTAFIRAMSLGNKAEAERLAAKAEANNTDRVRGLSYRARMASFDGNHTEAAALLRQATALGTADAAIHRLLARELSILGRVDEAVASFEQALQIRPDDVQTIFDYVQVLAQADRKDQALDVARKQQRYGVSFPPFVELWLHLESVAGGPDGLARAVSQRERMLEINPGDRNNRGSLAIMYMEQKRWSDAKTLIDSMRAEQDSLPLVELAARWSADQGRVGTRDGMQIAQETYQKYIDQSADNTEKLNAYISLTRFSLGRGRADLAVQAIDQAVAIEDPATMDATKLKGDLLLQLGRTQEASAEYQRVVDAGADTAAGDYRERLIEMYLRTESWERAKEHMAKLPASRTGTLTNSLQRAEIAQLEGDSAEERRILDDAVARFPDNPLVYIRRAMSMMGNADLQTDVLSDLEAALRVRPNDARALRIRSTVFFNSGRRAEAMRDLRDAVRANPADDAILFGLLNELLNDGKPGEAIDVAREVVGKRSNDATLMSQLGLVFEARELWDRASEMYGLAWNARRSPGDGAKYIDMLLRRTPPDANTANSVLDVLVGLMGGNIDKSPGLLAAQALVLRARGREDFALQQMTKAFEIARGDDARMTNWGTNAARFYRGMTPESEINYYRTLRTSFTDPATRAWLDLFIAQRRLDFDQEPDQMMSELRRLGGSEAAPIGVRQLALRILGNRLYARERYDDAIGAWQQGLELTGENWEMSNNIAYTMSAKLGKHEEALVLAERAVAADPSRSEPYDTLATIYISLGKYDESGQMIAQGMRRARSFEAQATMSLTQAKLELARGDRGAAAGSVQQARDILRWVAGRNETLQGEIDRIEEQIGSAD